MDPRGVPSMLEIQESTREEIFNARKAVVTQSLSNARFKLNKNNANTINYFKLYYNNN